MSENKSKVVLGEQLKLLREKNGVSQEEVAEKLYVTRQTVSNWERGRCEPDLASLQALCSLYNTSVDKILSEDIVDSNTGSSEQPQHQKSELPISKRRKILSIIGFSLLAVVLWELMGHLLRQWLDEIFYNYFGRVSTYELSAFYWLIAIFYHTVLFVSGFFALYFAEKKVGKGSVLAGGTVYSLLWIGYTIYSFVHNVDMILSISLLFLLHLILIVLPIYCIWKCFSNNSTTLPEKSHSWHKKTSSTRISLIIHSTILALIAFLISFVLTEIGVGFVDSTFSLPLHEGHHPVAYWVLHNLVALFALGVGLLFAFFLSPCSTPTKGPSVIVYGILNLLYFLWSFSIRFITKTHPISNIEGNVTAGVLTLHLVLIAASALILFWGIRGTGKPAEEKREIHTTQQRPNQKENVNSLHPQPL